MQLTNYKPRYIERILNTDEGVFLARFVVEVEGNSFRLKLVDMISHTSENKLSNSVLQIAAPKIKSVISYVFKTSAEIISPFTNLDFFISQPTRAPSL